MASEEGPASPRGLRVFGESCKAEARVGDSKVEYLKLVAESQKQFDGLKVQAAKTWDVADDKWDTTSKDLELKWEEWQLNAKKMWNDLTK